VLARRRMENRDVYGRNKNIGNGGVRASEVLRNTETSFVSVDVGNAEEHSAIINRLALRPRLCRWVSTRSRPCTAVPKFTANTSKAVKQVVN
jgi:hypothetical protein